VAGYSCFMDATVRDMQFTWFTAGKNWPQTGEMYSIIFATGCTMLPVVSFCTSRPFNQVLIASCCAGGGGGLQLLYGCDRARHAVYLVYRRQKLAADPASSPSKSNS
jgi:hypothetical protein